MSEQTFFDAIGILVASLLISVLFALWRARRESKAADEYLTGRQQLRAAAREEGYKAIGGSAVARRTKRQAARDIARKVV